MKQIELANITAPDPQEAIMTSAIYDVRAVVNFSLCSFVAFERLAFARALSDAIREFWSV